jgi:FkbH-like protein
MVLRQEDFAGWRINWEDKAKNVLDLTKELNVGLEATVFIDDNPAERARMRQALADVLTPDWPSDCMLYERALKQLDCFDAVGITDEDRHRAAMYVTERGRRRAVESAGNLTEYLESLALRVAVDPLSQVTLVRACQLLNKTNQMNLRTRRMTDAQYWEWACGPARRVFTYRVDDRFGEYGLTGLAGVTVADGACLIEDFVLSCRVMGRGVEEVILHTLVEHARALGARTVRATVVPTDRNEPCRQFFESRSGFDRDGNEYSWDAGNAYPPPRHVEVVSLPGRGDVRRGTGG